MECRTGFQSMHLDVRRCEEEAGTVVPESQSELVSLGISDVRKDDLLRNTPSASYTP